MHHECKASPLVLSGGGGLKQNQFGMVCAVEKHCWHHSSEGSPLLKGELQHQNDKWKLLIKFQITPKGIWQLLNTVSCVDSHVLGSSEAKLREKVIFYDVDILCNSDQTFHESYYNVPDVSLLIVTDVKYYYRASHFQKKE